MNYWQALQLGLTTLNLVSTLKTGPPSLRVDAVLSFVSSVATAGKIKEISPEFLESIRVDITTIIDKFENQLSKKKKG